MTRTLTLALTLAFALALVLACFSLSTTVLHPLLPLSLAFGIFPVLLATPLYNSFHSAFLSRPVEEPRLCVRTKLSGRQVIIEE